MVPESEIDTFVAGFAVPEPSVEPEAEAGEATRPPARDSSRRPPPRYFELGEGDGAPVLLVHGFGVLSQYLDVPQRGVFCRQRRVVALDLPGTAAPPRK